MSSPPPIFVLGTGRSGTSTVARLLHEALGVSMGSRFREPCRENPQGFYEDLDFKDYNQWILSPPHEGDERWLGWFSGIAELIRARQRTNRPWGVKDPRLCYLVRGYLSFCPGAVLIFCRRDLEATAQSMARCYGWSLPEARQEAKSRLAKLRHLCDSGGASGALHLDFDDQRTDGWVLGKLASFLRSHQITISGGLCHA